MVAVIGCHGDVGSNEITDLHDSLVRKSSIRTGTQNPAALPENSHKLPATIIIIIIIFIDGHGRGDEIYRIPIIRGAHLLDRTTVDVSYIIILYIILRTLSTECPEYTGRHSCSQNILLLYCCCWTCIFDAPSPALMEFRLLRAFSNTLRLQYNNI